MIHAVYPSVETKRTYVLYHPDKKTATLHIIHNLKQTISSVLSPKLFAQYLKTGDITIPGYPCIDETTNSHIKTLIELTGGNPQG